MGDIFCSWVGLKVTSTNGGGTCLPARIKNLKKMWEWEVFYSWRVLVFGTVEEKSVVVFPMQLATDVNFVLLFKASS